MAYCSKRHLIHCHPHNSGRGCVSQACNSARRSSSIRRVISDSKTDRHCHRPSAAPAGNLLVSLSGGISATGAGISRSFTDLAARDSRRQGFRAICLIRDRLERAMNLAIAVREKGLFESCHTRLASL